MGDADILAALYAATGVDWYVWQQGVHRIFGTANRAYSISPPCPGGGQFCRCDQFGFNSSKWHFSPGGGCGIRAGAFDSLDGAIGYLLVATAVAT